MEKGGAPLQEKQLLREVIKYKVGGSAMSTHSIQPLASSSSSVIYVGRG